MLGQRLVGRERRFESQQHAVDEIFRRVQTPEIHRNQRPIGSLQRMLDETRFTHATLPLGLTLDQFRLNSEPSTQPSQDGGQR